MNYIPKVEQLKSMLALHEKRAAILSNLDAIDSELSRIQARLANGSAPVATAPAAKAAPTVKVAPKAFAPRAKRGSSGRGALRAKIFALQEAGKVGVKVQPLAAALGTKAANIYAWFHAAVKRYPAIKKLDGAHYRIEGSVAEAAASPKAAGWKTRAAKSAPKVPKAGKARGKIVKAGRGELKGRILDTLKTAGKSGASVKEISDELGVKYKNVQVWFATTGKKKELGIKKIGPALYQRA
jgi:hypothetical protein